MYGVREWDYLFHFYTPGVGVDPDNTSGVDGITTCQYKVIFDKHKFARSFHWNPVFPQGAVCPPPQPEPPKAEPQVIIREVEAAPAKKNPPVRPQRDVENLMGTDAAGRGPYRFRLRQHR